MRKVGWVVLCLAFAVGAVRAQTGTVADANGVYFASKGFEPQLTRAIPADYPSDPGVAHLKHSCVFDVVVGVDGRVQSVRLENVHPSPFDANAQRAVEESAFDPVSLNGRVVPVRAQVAVTFHGDGSPAVPELEGGPTFQYPKATYSPHAEFSDEGRRKKVSGVLLLSFIVTEDGMPTDVEVVLKLGYGLDEEAVKAVNQWRFSPGRLDDRPVPVRLTTEVSFRSR